MNGVVTYAAGLSAGDYVEADRGIVTVADPGQLIILYKPSKLEEIYTGMTLDIALKNDEKYYTGTVVQTPSDVPAGASEEDRANVYIELDETPEFATIGTSVTITILLEKKEDVIALPSKYLSKVSTRYYVRVLVDGLPRSATSRSASITAASTRSPAALRLVKSLSHRCGAAYRKGGKGICGR